MRHLVAAFLATLSSLAGAEEARLQFSTQVEAFSEPVSIDAFTSGWKDNFRGGDDAGLHARAELRADKGPWAVAWRWRYDYQLEFAPGTADLYHRIRNNLPVEPGHAYPLDIRAFHVERHGPALGYRIELNRLQLEASLSLYQGLSVIDGHTHGRALFATTQPSGDEVQDLLAVVDYRYSEPQLQEEDLDWRPPPPEGWGYGLDISGRWQSASGAAVALQVQDAAGAIFWQDIPSTKVVARCNCTIPNYDVNGGLAVQDHWRQRLNPWIQATAEYPVSAPWLAVARLASDSRTTIRQFGGAYANTTQRVTLLYEPSYRAWRLAYEDQHIRLSWTADKLDTSSASRLGIDFSLLWQW